MMKKVEIYSTATCHYCVIVKDFLKDHGVDYVDYNVGTDLVKRKEMVELSGQMGVPVVKIGTDVIVGFNEEQIKSSLGLK